MTLRGKTGLFVNFFKRHLQTAIGRLKSSEDIGSVLSAMTVGLVGGAGVILLYYLIMCFEEVFFSGGKRVLPFMGGYYVILLPAVGTLIVNYIVRKWAIEAQGHGVPEVMYAIKKEGGRIRPRVALVKTLASALCIGSGGSVGREGPIVQIGCSLGSSLGQFLGFREEKVKVLVACGAAAAIGGAFNAPLSGVMFALEVVLCSFAVRSFGTVVIASVTATALCRAAFGAKPAFQLVNAFRLQSPWELFLYLGLGVCMGIAALIYVRTLYFWEGTFENWSWNTHVKAFVGGLAMGLIGYLGIRYFGGSHLFGGGYEGIDGALGLGGDPAQVPALSAKMTIGVLLGLVILKILATSLVLSAGGSGGVFAPALYIGAMAGGAYGLIMGELFPGIAAPAGAYALVGMAALFSGAAHASITSIMILFEMTDDYKIILPLMLAAVVSHLMASNLYPDSIYTIKLRRRGGLAPPRSEQSVLDLILVADAMTSGEPTVEPDVPITDLAEQLHQGSARSFPVVENGKLVGIVTETDVESALTSNHLEGRKAKDIMTRKVITCTPGETLQQVLKRFGKEQVRRIPVVDPKDAQRFLGVLRREEIFWAYGKMALEHRRLLNKTGIKLATHHKDSVQIEVEVKSNHSICFKTLRDIKMPDQCLIVVLRRAERAIVPRGKTVIEPGDVLVALTTTKHETRLRDWASSLNGLSD